MLSVMLSRATLLAGASLKRASVSAKPRFRSESSQPYGALTVKHFARHLACLCQFNLLPSTDVLLAHSHISSPERETCSSAQRKALPVSRKDLELQTCQVPVLERLMSLAQCSKFHNSL